MCFLLYFNATSLSLIIAAKYKQDAVRVWMHMISIWLAKWIASDIVLINLWFDWFDWCYLLKNNQSLIWSDLTPQINDCTNTEKSQKNIEHTNENVAAWWTGFVFLDKPRGQVVNCFKRQADNNHPGGYNAQKYLQRIRFMTEKRSTKTKQKMRQIVPKRRYTCMPRHRVSCSLDVFEQSKPIENEIAQRLKINRSGCFKLIWDGVFRVQYFFEYFTSIQNANKTKTDRTHTFSALDRCWRLLSLNWWSGGEIFESSLQTINSISTDLKHFKPIDFPPWFTHNNQPNQIMKLIKQTKSAVG